MLITAFLEKKNQQNHLYFYVETPIYYFTIFLMIPLFISLPLAGCGILNILILLKLSSVQPFPRTAGPCPEPEWPDPDIIWHLRLRCWVCWTPVLCCSALCQVREAFHPAILLPITYCIPTLLVCFRHQECCRSLSVQFDIWMYRNATKLRMVYINTKPLKKFHFSEVN